MNAQAAVLRREIEAKLAHRIPGALSSIAQQALRLQSTGNARLDALLNGGLPLGSVLRGNRHGRFWAELHRS